ncbi:MAG: cytochrome ubiquinol oxidase subunit I [Desulfobulbaceae bacterium]|uniref:Cytochrome ubiquinol oxidase subunit I n=1 Tax=Candidatus Desulfatifera sulfidica TaxID=2841691 RepID=A0A8J6N9H1_9BACT|nr:cytochrome ubiquinol oxidase subunit I [Candidatus Desulfatifera sulfidica]
MNYPIWQLDAFGGGFLIALIAVVHVFISHFAVGGGLFLVLMERKALAENSNAIMDYVRRHAKFFLILTMVFGAMTGVGIWLTISLLNPTATSHLIHTFVFAWAAEWVFFLAEIVSILFYYYTFDRLSPRRHMLLGWIYFGCAWMSLFLINGIIDYMLTPGAWLENRNFWSGFFNPTFWPALFFRTFLALMIAGLFGLLTSTWIKDREVRHTLVAYCGRWLLIPLALLILSALWYKAALPAAQQEMIFQTAPELKIFLFLFTWLSPVFVGLGLILAVVRPMAIQRPLALILLFCGFCYIGSFEFIREGGRRPYIIHNYLYSNSILKDDLATVQAQGVLNTARWVKNRTVTVDNQKDAGRELFNLLCLPCHSAGGPLNDIRPRVATFTPETMGSFLAAMGSTNPYMPPFPGNKQEQTILADYLTNNLTPPRSDTGLTAAIDTSAPLPFDPETATHVLLASTDRSMTMSSQPALSGIDLSFAPPTLQAQLIERSPSPSVIANNVTISYRILNHQPLLSGQLKGNGDGVYSAQLPGLNPARNPFSPHVIAELTATQDGQEIAQTTTRIRISTELGCRSCHGGSWSTTGAGLSRETATHILASHDRRSNTSLAEAHRTGTIITCSDCHKSSNQPGQPDTLNLSAAMHGFHAGFLAFDFESCNYCHASNFASASNTFDGLHAGLGLECGNCHGTISDHAASLLKHEAAQGKKMAVKRLNQLAGTGEVDQNEIVARTPWTMQPDCLNCHEDFAPPETMDGFNTWTTDSAGLFHNRTDEAGVLRCTSCHGPTHGIYPADSEGNGQAAVLQPLQYQGTPYPISADRGCAVCHTMDMEDEMHHPGSLANFRNRLD